MSAFGTFKMGPWISPLDACNHTLSAPKRRVLSARHVVNRLMSYGSLNGFTVDGRPADARRGRRLLKSYASSLLAPGWMVAMMKAHDQAARENRKMPVNFSAKHWNAKAV